MKKQLFKSYIVGILFLNIITGCSEDYTISQPENKSEVTFVLNISAPEIPVTRSVDYANEYLITEVVLIAFKYYSNNDKRFAYSTTGTNISTSTEDSTVEFSAFLEPEANYIFGIIANPGEDIKNIIQNELEIGESSQSVYEKLIYTHTGKWETNFPIPMYGETNRVSVQSGSVIKSNPLKRLLARIDISVNLDNDSENTFLLKKVHLCNYNTKGYLASWHIGMGDFPIPPDPGQQTGLENILVYEVEDASPTFANYTGQIYIFETKIDFEDPTYTCFILEGYFNEELTFYKIPIVSNRIKSLWGSYLYSCNVVEANRIGYLTLSEAINSAAVVSNYNKLTTKPITNSSGELATIVWDQEYMFGTTVIDGVIDIGSAESTGNSFIAYTNYPNGYTVTSHDPETNSTANWLRFSTGGRGQEYQTFSFDADANQGYTDREGKLIFRAGRLRDTITVRQSYIPDL